ncbi:LicD family protein [Pediococcus ethanolidurans]|uniref:LicD family protein n=1 Tax=Pediococcus ethanolidurans TaxID=319653 RepID=UPI0021E7A5E5|nr:LicD family protein [Pediococcus ethanolidurans]MCV3327717.1 LicD family protein [Pediococcus ethanolidurans]
MQSDLRKLQKIDAKILTNVVSVLNQHKLKYYLIGGTLLGAVRHKGFIPWDDDVDIAMPREDYDKFLKQFTQELPKNLEVKNFMNDSSYKYYITRVLDTDHKVEELREQNKKKALTNVSIDIFPIDGVPNNYMHRKIYYLHVLFLRAIISLIQKDNIDHARKRNVVEKVAIYIGTCMPLEKFFTVNKLQKRIDCLLKKQSKESIYVGTIMGAYRTKEIVQRNYFGNGKVLEFEGKNFIVPSNYDAYLKHMYGDYMQLPSKEQQKSKKHFRIVN